MTVSPQTALTPLDVLVREIIQVHGSIRYRDVVDLALYHPEHGFYTQTGSAGRRGDFLTSPEVGPLFGELIARAIDREWERCGRPSEFVVVDAGAGPGTLARSVLAAEPSCVEALQWVAVETSARQREMHPDGIRSVAEMPAEPFVGMVIANELLDNLAFDPVTRVDGEWRWVVVREDDGRLVERPGERHSTADELFKADIHRAVDQSRAADWLDVALTTVSFGRVLVIDYARSSSSDVEIRTYVEHDRARDPLIGLGGQDITVDVDLAQLARRVRPPDRTSSQDEFLADLGMAQLVEEGRAAWREGAAVGDLASLKARSRVREAEALSDPDGLGGFTVAEWVLD